MYLFKKGLLPNYFCNMFTFASQLHSHYTRNCNHYYIPPCRTNIRNFSIRFQGPKFFNSETATIITYLPVELILETSQFGFKDLSFSIR